CEMELVDGETLASRVEREGPYEWREGVKLLVKIAQAIDHVHGREVTHRDLKPENILVRKSDGAPLVADLGLARLRDQASSLTKTGALVGTPLYIAPEGLFGETGPPADIYALGGILAFVVTGKPPFDAEAIVALLVK